MAEALSGVVLGRLFTAANGYSGETVSAERLRALLQDNPGGRAEERWSPEGEWRGYRYVVHGGLWVEW